MKHTSGESSKVSSKGILTRGKSRSHLTLYREGLFKSIEEIVAGLTDEDIKKMWRWASKSWLATLVRGHI